MLATQDVHAEIKHATQGLNRDRAGGLALLDESGHVRALADIEAEAIRFAIGHYRGQMSEVARRLHIGRSTLYQLVSLGLDAEISGAKVPTL